MVCSLPRARVKVYIRVLITRPPSIHRIEGGSDQIHEISDPRIGSWEVRITSLLHLVETRILGDPVDLRTPDMTLFSPYLDPYYTITQY